MATLKVHTTIHGSKEENVAVERLHYAALAIRMNIRVSFSGWGEAQDAAISIGSLASSRGMAVTFSCSG